LKQYRFRKSREDIRWSEQSRDRKSEQPGSHPAVRGHRVLVVKATKNPAEAFEFGIGQWLGYHGKPFNC
jgi:hypothetical protein